MSASWGKRCANLVTRSSLAGDTGDIHHQIGSPERQTEPVRTMNDTHELSLIRLTRRRRRHSQENT
jgi:hypothetical protein